MSVRPLLLAAALLLGAAVRAPAQAPRFLHIAAGSGHGTVIIDPADDPVLSRRLAIRLRGVTRVAAVQEIALSAGVELVYAADLLPRYGPRAGEVSVESYDITVAAALTEVLRGAGVDIAIGAGGSMIVVRQPAPAAPAATTAAVLPAGAAAGAVALAPIVTVAAQASRQAFELEPSTSHLEVGVKELAAAPAPFEADLLRTVELLPGVESKNDYSAGLNVRGGESDQNLILLDGYPIYNPFHLGGLLGTFIDPLVGKVDLITGAQPSRYGGRLSSVLDVHSSGAARSGLHGEADVSLLSATATAGSAFDGGGSWTIGGRHTYADVIANLIRKNSLPYGFSDAQAHLSRPVLGGAVLELTGYSGSDGSNISGNDGGLDVSWGNHLVGATLSKVMPEPRRLLGILPVDSVAWVQRASFTTFDASAVMPTRLFDLRSSVRDLRASGALTLFTASLDQSIGYEISAQRLRYSMQAPITSITNFLPQVTLDQSLTPVSAWYDARWRPAARLIVDAGVRVDAVGGTGWTGVSPRLAVKYFLTDELALTAATGSYAQWLHSLAQEDAPVQPLEFWVASNRSLPVSRAWQTSLGAEAWASPVRQLRVEAYYKRYSNLLETDAAADPGAGDDPFTALAGTSYGADLLVRQLDTGKFGGWIAYSYAASERVTPAGVRFSPGQDRRHQLNVVGTWKFQRYRLSARFGMSTGTPYTPIVGEFTRERYSPLGNGYAPDFGDSGTQYLSGATNSARLPLAHRLDVSITRIATAGRVQVSPYLSIANVYGAANPAVYLYDYANVKVVGGAQVPDPQRTSIGNLPFLPTIGVHIAY